MDRGLIFIVHDATAVEIAILLGKFEWGQGPVRRVCGNDIDMCQQQERLLFRVSAAIAGNQVTFAFCRLHYLDIFGRESGGQEFVGHRLRRSRVVTIRMRRIDFDQFAQEVLRILLVRRQIATDSVKSVGGSRARVSRVRRGIGRVLRAGSQE